MARTGSSSLASDGREVRLTHLEEPFWPSLGLTERELLSHRAGISPALLALLRFARQGELVAPIVARSGRLALEPYLKGSASVTDSGERSRR